MEPCLVMPFFFSLSSFLPPSSFQPPSSSPFFPPFISRFIYRYGFVGPLRVPAIIGGSLHLLMYIVFFFFLSQTRGMCVGPLVANLFYV